MITRLITIVIAGIVLMGYAPRWLATSDQAWIIWVAAAVLVFGGPKLLRYAIKSAASRVSALPAASTVSSAIRAMRRVTQS